MALTNSPFSSMNLRKHPQRFFTLLGVSVEQFDAIFEKLYALEIKRQKQRLPLRSADRIERMVARHASTLREYLCITLLYIRQYNIQEILATSFGITQGQISKIIKRILPMLEEILPVPERAAAAILETIRKIDPAIRKEYAAALIVDASEQRIERNFDQTKQRKDYSGKKKCHSRKFQIIITLTAIILDISKAFNGSIHDFKIFKEHLINRSLKRLLKLMKKVIIYGDSAYEAIARLFPDWIALINEKGKRGHPLTDEQKLKNKLKTKIRILVEHVISFIKKYRSCAERVRNMSATKQSQFWNVVAGIYNLRRATMLGISEVFGYVL